MSAMLKKSVAWFLIALVAGCARASVMQDRPGVAPSTETSGDSSAVISSLNVGPLPPPEIPTTERLDYQVSWWGIPVALATVTSSPVSDPADIEKLVKDGFQPKTLMKLDCQARTTAYLEPLFPIRVRLTSFLDPESRNPRRFETFVRQRFRKHESVEIFHPEKGEAFHQLPKGRSKTVPIGPTTQDALSLVYYVRTVPFQVGQEVPIEVSAEGQNWHVNGKIIRTGAVQIRKMKRWPAVAGWGELDYPIPFFQGAKAVVWFSANPERIPLLAKINSRLGPISIVLTRRTAGNQRE